MDTELLFTDEFHDVSVPPKKPKLKQKRRKLRRLAHENHGPRDWFATRPGWLQVLRRGLCATMISSVVLGVLLGHYFANTDGGQRSLFRDFISSYNKHYYQIIYTPNYCDTRLDTDALMSLMNQHRILHQEDAMQQLSVLLRNDSMLNSIALVGPPGVGKSLWARALEQHFPWRENVRSYSWNTFVQDDAEKFRILRMFIDHFSDCGRNLLVIDNLTPCDREVVPLVNKLIEKREGGKRPVTIIYIFKLNSFLEGSVLREQIEMLQNLPNTKIVNFRRLGIEELKGCIRREALLENVTLTKRAFHELVNSIDVEHAGCKNVQAKVLLYKKPDMWG